MEVCQHFEKVPGLVLKVKKSKQRRKVVQLLAS
jgi:hypothetical protein